ncbi:rubredoxin domain-containing protein [Mucilaginibacter arboris]|uniref:Rubredoxin n=1 Tax=Mucilaginibacter arboris TaxID=2682090 RepID=A0A7K1SW91_9SPHI|nr:rubredoxin domain-containing protein [Mucilaginibacter arboris]MVN21592.1 rubredoxin [Mucilaginibacter arboris]
MENATEFTMKINLSGGIISPGDLQEALNIAEKSGATDIVFGNRQQLFFKVKEAQLDDLNHELLMADIHYEMDSDEYPNIMSSYVTDDIFDNPNWLSEGVFKDIFDLFYFRPKLKINLIGSNQTFVPFFTGNLNFVSSEVSNYWFLYVRFPKTNQLYCWPSLIYSEDISEISKNIERQILENKNLFYDQQNINAELLYEKTAAKNSMAIQPIQQQLKLPDFQLPYYEGFNRYGNNKLWLGIYRRNESFSIDLLKDICKICLKTRIGQLHITPWKSLVVKGIEPADRKYWGKILDQYRINVRHASNELNWQLENLCAEGLRLKQELVRQFEEADLRTYRLCFAIKTHLKSGLFGSVIIRKLLSTSDQEQALFEILHTRDFNPNTKEFVVYKINLQEEQLGPELIALCNYYYELQNDHNLSALNEIIAEEISADAAIYFVYQCKNCLTIYDQFWGDELNSISAGTNFTDLVTYQCPTCDSPKEDFIAIEKVVPHLASV